MVLHEEGQTLEEALRSWAKFAGKDVEPFVEAMRERFSKVDWDEADSKVIDHCLFDLACTEMRLDIAMASAEHRTVQDQIARVAGDALPNEQFAETITELLMRSAQARLTEAELQARTPEEKEELRPKLKHIVDEVQQGVQVSSGFASRN